MIENKTGLSNYKLRFKIILLSLFFVLYFSSAYSQSTDSQERINRVSLNYGKTYHVKLDQTYSRLAKSGFTDYLSLDYEYLDDDRIMGVQTFFGLGELTTNNNLGSKLVSYSSGLSFRYLRRISVESLSKCSLYAGLNFGLGGELWFPDSALAYGWDINSGVGTAIAAIYQINSKLYFKYDFDMYLLGVLWRSNNNGQQLTTEEIQLQKGIAASAFESPRFSNTFNNLKINNSLKIAWCLSDRLEFSYVFMLAYRCIQKPLIKKGYEFNNAIGLSLKF